MGVKDEFHQRAILACVDELCQRSAPPKEAPPRDAADAPPSHHRLVECSFSTLERCDKCHKFLRGLLHQGLVCHCEPLRFVTSPPLFFLK